MFIFKRALVLVAMALLPALSYATLTLPTASCDTAGIGSMTMLNEGVLVKRTFRMFIPCNGSVSMPVLIALHYAGANGLKMENTTGFDALAKTEKFIVVYPDSTVLDAVTGKMKYGVSTWNDGRVYGDNTDKKEDVSFIAQLADELAAAYPNVNRGRVYVTGLASGASLVHRLACELPTGFAAFAPVASTLATAPANNCDYNGPVNMLMIAGTADPYNFWCSTDPLLDQTSAPCVWETKPASGWTIKAGSVLNIMDTYNFWTARTQCTSEIYGAEVNKNTTDGTSVVKITSSNNGLPCGAGSLTFYAIKGGGHAWPGHKILTATGGINFPTNSALATSMEIDATKVVWNYLKVY
jgi:polyhydroxybutyrate depolymerase